MDKIYLAGPFFTPEQIIIVDAIRNICTANGFGVYSPKDECMYEEGVTKPKDILQQNVMAIIERCAYLIAITDGKDVGTMFECGYAYAMHIPIIYIWLGAKEGGKFNIMLQASADAVCLSYTELIVQLQAIRASGRCAAHAAEYSGEMQ